MKPWLKYLSEVLCCGCAGIIIDFIVGQSYVFTLLGLAVGIVLMLIQHINSKKEREK